MTPPLLIYSDDDMQSTFSSMDPAQSVMYADDEDDIDEDDLDEAATLGIKYVTYKL